MSVGIPRSTAFPFSSNSTAFDRRRGATLHPGGIVLPRPVGAAAHRSVLFGPSTSISREMSTTYHPHIAAYDGYGANGHPTSFDSSSMTKAANNVMDNTRHAGYITRQQQMLTNQYSSHAAAPVVGGHRSSASTSNPGPYSQQQQQPQQQHHSQPSTPPSQSLTSFSSRESTSKPAVDTLIYHSLQIPKCISPNGGNLADFAAQMTCLFWFQPIEDLKRAESILSYPSDTPISRLSALAKPPEQFCKWVLNVLSTTQITQNVILLALLFIYRLKKSTPQIKGRSGSEYRLLTVALMLGNKFLDDNTYTNKTWAEVSCFAVQEIHVMEVEFLSNMRYNLLASKTEWEDWLSKLACFHEYYERASRPPTSPLRTTSPNRLPFVPIPIPTTNESPVSTTFPDYGPVTPSGRKHFSPNANQNQNWNPYQTNTTSPLASKPVMRASQSRKRSYDDDTAADHPAKRHLPTNIGYAAQDTGARINPASNVSRLPVPQLTLVTSTGPTISTSTYTTTPVNAYPAVHANVSLPPLHPGPRAMATVFQSTTAPMAQFPASTGPAAAQYSGLPGPVSQQAVQPVMHAATPSKRRSPGSLAPFASSPMVEPYGPSSTMHTPLALTPIANSPSVYLQHRNSPYKPIRHVNTLLHPPPSASLDQYHLSLPVPPSQMHYQPLGRRYDLRTGIVPEFVRYHRAQQQQHQQHQHQHQQQQVPQYPPPNQVNHHNGGYMGQYAP